MSVLEDGDIPLLRCHRKAGTPAEMSLSYVRLSSSTHYTAVSHLWSDGLATPSRNSLPKCQLQHLCNRIQAAESYGRKGGWFKRRVAQARPSLAVTKPILLWLDVYCVPTSTSSKDLRETNVSKLLRLALWFLRTHWLGKHLLWTMNCSISLQQAQIQIRLGASCTGGCQQLALEMLDTSGVSSLSANSNTVSWFDGRFQPQSLVPSHATV